MRALLLCLLLLPACDGAGPAQQAPPAEDVYAPQVVLGRHQAAITDTRRVVPGPGLPAEAAALAANNNLDVVRHEGRVYLAFRTAPNHFASAQTAIHVVSSTDEQTWRFETTFRAGTDLREPRLLSLGGDLFVYLARLGTDAGSFEPQGMSYARLSQGAWSPLREFYRPGFIPWRARVERGAPYLVAYLGGEHIYRFDGIPLQIELLTTRNGIDWEGADPKQPVVSEGGGSETDFVLTDEGALLAVTRNEAGDETGWGSKVCRAPAGAITRWTCKTDPRKYDSPLMFYHDGEAYLIARRNLSPSGAFDLMQRQANRATEALSYQLDYWNRPKRCALWRYDQAADRIVFILDLPSRGDTCFPGLIQGASPGEFIVYNYSSDVDGPELSWHDGQESPTFIYRHVLRLTRR